MDQQNNAFDPINFEAEQSKQTTQPAGKTPKTGKKGGATWLLGVVIAVAIVALAGLCVKIFAPDLFNKIFNSTALSRGEDVVLSVGDFDVSAVEYNHYLYPLKVKYEANDATYWKTHIEEGESFKNQALELFRDNAAMMQWAKDVGIEMTDDDRAAVAEQIATVKLSYTTEAEFYAALEANYLTLELYTKIMGDNLLFNKLYEYVYTESDMSVVSDEEVAAYAQENNLYGAKHILITSTGEEAPDAERRALAEEILGKLQAGEDFDTLMMQYTEDPGITSYPNGYTFTDGEMVEPFETAVKGLEIGGLSGIVETTNGYHIILRIEPDKATVTDAIIAQRATAKLDEYHESMPVKYSRGYDKITIDQTFWNYASTHEETKAAA